MDLSHSVLTPPPVLDALASDAALTYSWLQEAWFIRLRWVALPLCLLAVPFVPRATWPMRLLFPLALALGNGWLVWRLRRAQGGHLPAPSPRGRDRIGLGAGSPRPGDVCRDSRP